MSTAKRKGSTAKKKELPPRCTKCGHRDAKKNGMALGEQRWKCRSCGYQFTRVEPRGRPFWQKSLVAFLYSYGVSMHAIAKIFQVQPSTILKWVRSYSKHYEPKIGGNISLMELKDMQRHLGQKGKKKKATLCIAIDNETFRKNIGIAISNADR